MTAALTWEPPGWLIGLAVAALYLTAWLLATHDRHPRGRAATPERTVPLSAAPLRVASRRPDRTHHPEAPPTSSARCRSSATRAVTGS